MHLYYHVCVCAPYITMCDADCVTPARGRAFVGYGAVPRGRATPRDWSFGLIAGTLEFDDCSAPVTNGQLFRTVCSSILAAPLHVHSAALPTSLLCPVRSCFLEKNIGIVEVHSMSPWIPLSSVTCDSTLSFPIVWAVSQTTNLQYVELLMSPVQSSSQTATRTDFKSTPGCKSDAQLSSAVNDCWFRKRRQLLYSRRNYVPFASIGCVDFNKRPFTLGSKWCQR